MCSMPNFVLDRVADVESVLLWHHDVEENHLRLFHANCFERFFTVRRGEKLDAFVFEFLQRLLDQRAQMRLVINNKNLHSVH